jgi:hypothetical protein
LNQCALVTWMPETNDERAKRIHSVAKELEDVASLYSNISDKLLIILERDSWRMAPRSVDMIQAELAHTHDIAAGLFAFSKELRKL